MRLSFFRTLTNPLFSNRLIIKLNVIFGQLISNKQLRIYYKSLIIGMKFEMNRNLKPLML